jgi:hypothetical protein
MQTHHVSSPAGAFAALAGVALLAAFIFAYSRRVYQNGGGSVIVRCRDGHLFTTVWIPGVSFKAARLGTTRWQRCLIGNHWTVVARVDPSTLTEEERAYAAAHRDSRLP